VIEIVTGKEPDKIDEHMINIASETGMDFFRANGQLFKVSNAMILIVVA